MASPPPIAVTERRDGEVFSETQDEAQPTQNRSSLLGHDGFKSSSLTGPEVQQDQAVKAGTRSLDSALANGRKADAETEITPSTSDTPDVDLPSSESPATKKHRQLQEQIGETRRKREQIEKQLHEAQEQLGDADANDIVKQHISLLHQYNEIKDVCMGLFGLIADTRGVRVKDVFEEFGVTDDD